MKVYKSKITGWLYAISDDRYKEAIQVNNGKGKFINLHDKAIYNIPFEDLDLLIDEEELVNRY